MNAAVMLFAWWFTGWWPTCTSVVKEGEPDWIHSSTNTWVEQDFDDQALFGKHVDNSGSVAETSIRSDISDAFQCCAARLFFRTREGYIGLGPSDTQSGDIIAIFLGCSTPLVLRPSFSSPEHHTVIGECFVYGFHDGNVLLGPLPSPWVGIAAWAEGDRRVLRFLNTETQEVSREDPRLEGDDLGEWEKTDKLVDGDEPTSYDFFRNKETDELINYDLRLEPECL
jgi:hypothetical protein